MSFFDIFFNKTNANENKPSSNELEGEKFFRQGIQSSQYGDNEGAIKFFSKSLEVSPNHAAVYVNRGASYMIQERYLEAYDDFTHAIDMEKNRMSLDMASCSTAALSNIKRMQVFLDFERKDGESLRKLFLVDGIDRFTGRWAEVIFDTCLENKIDSVNQFVHEEIKELEEMGGIHQEYALNCGVNYTEFCNVSDKYDTHRAFIVFKSMLCCFSRDVRCMFEIRTGVLNKLMAISKQRTRKHNHRINFDGRMYLKDAEVDVMFIVSNGSVIYTNTHVDHLYLLDDDGDVMLDGRVVNFTFKSANDIVEVFVAFDDQDSYTMFTLDIGRDDRLNYVAQAIFRFIGQNNINNVFSPVGTYSSQYHYTFKLYKKNTKHYMINNSHSQAYLIDDDVYMSNDVDGIKSAFWN